MSDNNLKIVKDPIRIKDRSNKYKVGIVSLGCDKNRVDSEIILGNMSRDYSITNNPKEADIIIVNTCGFIESAKQESIDTILEMADYKVNYKCKLLIATGCLIQRYSEELGNLIPELDLMLGVNDYDKINSVITNFINGNEASENLVNYTDEGVNEGTRILTTKKGSAYIRIAEGCNNFCTYCIIPKIRGKFRSRTMESVIKEVESLASQGVKEIILIAQDLTNYGVDIYNGKMLHKLAKKVSEVDNIEWVRLLYCYPEEIYDELIEEIATNNKIVKYLDIPIQHISDKILKLMGRKTNKKDIINIIDKLRKRIPNITLRTSLIVGFPNENDDDFNELKQFLLDYRLENVGVFSYSQEEGTPAAIMNGQIDESTKEKRLKELMLTQRKIMLDLNKLKIGNIYDTIIDGSNGEFFIGRSYMMSPEIDNIILVRKTKKVKIGDIIKVKITDVQEYDLIGDVIDESSK